MEISFHQSQQGSPQSIVAGIGPVTDANEFIERLPAIV